jgi:hypothetical protein
MSTKNRTALSGLERRAWCANSGDEQSGFQMHFWRHLANGRTVGRRSFMRGRARSPVPTSGLVRQLLPIDESSNTTHTKPACTHCPVQFTNARADTKRATCLVFDT